MWGARAWPRDHICATAFGKTESKWMLFAQVCLSKRIYQKASLKILNEARRLWRAGWNSRRFPLKPRKWRTNKAKLFPILPPKILEYRAGRFPLRNEKSKKARKPIISRRA